MLTDSSEWQALQAHFDLTQHQHMQELFTQDEQRFSKFSVRGANLLLDYSKNRINDKGMEKLFNLARAAKVEQQRELMLSGAAINSTEKRSVLHTALRNFSDRKVLVENQDVMPEIQQTLAKVKAFVDDVSSGNKTGYSGKAFTDVVSIGIGGSFLGPKIMSEALKPYQQKQLKVHFVANVDGCHITDVLAQLDPQTTLVITSSKTMTTQETLRNAMSAKAWFLKTASQQDIQHNFACVSSNIDAATDFGISEENIFPMWDWVGGRYSVWSAIGLPLALAIGFNHYQEFLEGAFAMDEHFTSEPLEQNMPVILALLGIWYRNFYQAQSHVLLPYYHYLRGLPAYVQQLDMESNGKQVTKNSDAACYDTGPIIWGSEGTNGQHSFHQLIHQGTSLAPIDFIMPLNPHHEVADHHDMLASNCFGQAQALMEGKTLEQVKTELAESGMASADIEKLAPHKVFAGNKPSNTLLFDQLDPKTLGSLIALYEHKVFVQGVIWKVNSFDQWGVELGKALGNKVLSKLKDKQEPLTMDSSTNALVELYRNRSEGLF